MAKIKFSYKEYAEANKIIIDGKPLYDLSQSGYTANQIKDYCHIDKEARYYVWDKSKPARLSYSKPLSEGLEEAFEVMYKIPEKSVVSYTKVRKGLIRVTCVKDIVDFSYKGWSKDTIWFVKRFLEQNKIKEG